MSESRELIEALNRFSDGADKLLANSNGGSATIHVNAGGVGVWLCVTACVVTFVTAIFLGAVVFWFAIKTNDQGHQMNAVYMSVPGLRELVERQMKQNEQTSKPPNQESEP